MFVAVFTVPPLVHGLGVSRFGVLSMAWILIGYFSLFDLGIGRALTKLVADELASGDIRGIPGLGWTGMFMLLLVGAAVGATTAILSPWLTHRVLKIPSDLQPETLSSFYLLSVAIPLVTVTSGWRGILEAMQHFAVLNLIRVPMSIFTFVGPLLVLPFSHSLVPVIGILVLGRLIGCIAHQVACLRALPAMRILMVKSVLISPLLKMGGWMTVSNVLGPVMLYVDRFIIGILLSIGAVAYYTAPFDMVSRLVFIPTSIAGVLFPAFAISMARDPDRTALLLSRGVKYTFLMILPIVLMIVCFAPEILRVWLGAAFAEHSTSVLRWLAMGILLNAITVIPFSLLQGIGRANLTAKVLLFELPFYLAAVWLTVARFGIEGAAVCWVVRAVLECLVLFAISHYCLPGARALLAKILSALGGAGIILSVPAMVSEPQFRALYLGTILACLTAATGLWGFSLEERRFLLTLCRGKQAATPATAASGGVPDFQ